MARQWPRDDFVRHRGRYVLRKSKQKADENPFGEGGHFRGGNDFLLASSAIYRAMPAMLEQKLTSLDLLGRKGDERRNAFVETFEAEAAKHYPGVRVHVIPNEPRSGTLPTGKKGGVGHIHLDMSTLLARKRKLLLVDTYFGAVAAESSELAAAAKKERLTVVEYDGRAEGIWYPLNGLVLPTEDGELAVVDKKAKSLIKILEGHGVEALGVDLLSRDYRQGGINCQTNVYDPALGEIDGRDELSYLRDLRRVLAP